MILFKVKIHHLNGNLDIYSVLGEDDLEARNKAINLDMKKYPINKYPGLDFCEIEFVIVVQG